MPLFLMLCVCGMAGCGMATDAQLGSVPLCKTYTIPFRNWPYVKAQQLKSLRFQSLSVAQKNPPFFFEGVLIVVGAFGRYAVIQ